ncbi:MAG TPA: DUF1206 domain-containing protein [Acidimicrobiales bacterium]|nr:DUF1206 domain-containing protein [Acidimicrobiales bacterium]
MAPLRKRGRGNDDRLVEFSGRAGLLSRAAIWLTIGVLTARLAAAGTPKAGAETDKSGAIRTLARQPFGRVLLALLLLGFIAMIVWAVIEAVRSRDGDGKPDWGHGLVAAGRAAAYAGLALTTLPLVFGNDEKGGSDQAQLTARVLGWPGGRLLVGAVALSLLAAAAYNVYRALSKRYEDHWDRSRMDKRARRIAGRLETCGNFGHALVFALVGWFLLMAAWQYDSSEPKGLDESLATLVRQSNGRLLCAVVAVGMAAWGINAIGQAMWRKVPADRKRS